MLLHGGAALKLKETQRVWHLMIPLYLGSPDEPINKARLSVLLIQVENRKSTQVFRVGEKEYSPLPTWNASHLNTGGKWVSLQQE